MISSLQEGSLKNFKSAAALSTYDVRTQSALLVHLNKLQIDMTLPLCMTACTVLYT